LKVLRGWGADHVRLQLLKLPLIEREGREDFPDEIWKRIDAFIERASAAGLQVVLDFHEHGKFYPNDNWSPSAQSAWDDPARQQRLCSLWRSIARHYASDRKRILGYDILNEPHPPYTDVGYAAWNRVAAAVVKAIREVDSYHTVIVPCAGYGNPGGMKKLKAIDDPGIVYSVHMYVPHEFTEQGTRPQWPFGQSYPGTVGLGWDSKTPTFINRYYLEESMAPVREFQLREGARIWVGEFSARRDAPDGSAYRYLRDLLQWFEEYGWSWAYHAFRESSVWDLEQCEESSCRKRHPTTRRLELVKSFYRGEEPLSWRGLFGVHYSLKEPYAGTVRGAPLHQWGPALDVTDRQDHEGSTPVSGPFSGQTRYLDFTGKYQRHGSNDAVVEEAGRKDITILAFQGLKLGPQLDAETPVWQDVAYAEVLRYNSGRFARFPLRYWQIGNEINGIGHFNIFNYDLKKVNRWAYFNRPEQLEAYVQRYFAPTLAAVRRASLDAYGDANRVQVVVGSVANAYRSESRQWLNNLLSASIQAPHYSELNGKLVWQVADIFSFHYLVTRAAPDWETSLDYLYQRWIASGRMKGMWATEEHGAKGRGYVTVLRVAARWLHFWCHHPWQRDRGRCIFWGPDRPKPGGKGIEAVRDLGTFFRDDPLEEVSDQVRISGEGDLQCYAFMVRGASGTPRICMFLFPSGESEGTLHRIDAPWIRPGMQVRWVMASNDRPRIEESRVLERASLSMASPTVLRGATEDTMLVFFQQ